MKIAHSLFRPSLTNTISSKQVAIIMHDVVASAPSNVSSQDKNNMLALVDAMLVSGIFQKSLKNLPVDQKGVATHVALLKVLSGLLPMGVMLSLFPTVVANGSVWQAKEGVPVGGNSQCVNQLIECFDLYFVREMQNWTTVDPQANRQIVSIASGMGNIAPLAAFRMLETCLNKTAVGDLVVNALQASNNTMLVGTCTAYGHTFQNWNTSSNALLMPTDSCPLYKDAFAARVKLCADQEALTANTGMLLGICASVFCILLLGVVSIKYFCKKKVVSDAEENLVADETQLKIRLH